MNVRGKTGRRGLEKYHSALMVQRNARAQREERDHTGPGRDPGGRLSLKDLQSVGPCNRHKRCFIGQKSRAERDL